MIFASKIVQGNELWKEKGYSKNESKMNCVPRRFLILCNIMTLETSKCCISADFPSLLAVSRTRCSATAGGDRCALLVSVCSKSRSPTMPICALSRIWKIWMDSSRDSPNLAAALQRKDTTPIRLGITRMRLQSRATAAGHRHLDPT